MKMMSYIVAGPTASGKSDFAHQLAKRIGGVVINCDSVQVYRGIETLSASPFAGVPLLWRGADEVGGVVLPDSQKDHPVSRLRDCHPSTGGELQIDGVPYRLFSITDGDRPLSAGIWANMARAEFDAATNSGKPSVFVGGAGFYLRALIDGMSPIPAVSDDARRAAREFAANDPAAAYDYLKSVDPEWAHKINQNDRQRLVRGIEVFRATGKPLSEWQRAPRIPIIPGNIKKILIRPDRDLLQERIASRMPALAKNAVAEVENILQKNWDPHLPIWKADGIAEMARYLAGEITFDTAVDLWRVKIGNHNMKKQYTWFKTNFHPDHVIDRIPTDADLIPLLGRGAAE